MKACLYNELKRTKSTSTDISFGGAYGSKMVAEQQGYHSIAPADKQVNE